MSEKGRLMEELLELRKHLEELEDENKRYVKEYDGLKQESDRLGSQILRVSRMLENL